MGKKRNLKGVGKVKVQPKRVKTEEKSIVQVRKVSDVGKQSKRLGLN
jgi:hypothetical protein